MERRILCRFGEITLKSRPVRRQFTRILMNNVRAALEHLDAPFQVRLSEAHIAVTCAHEGAVEALSRVFGLTSLAEVSTVSCAALEDIVRVGAGLFREVVRGKTFAVRCKRVGTHPFSSLDVERTLGAELAAYGTVNLSRPDVTCRVEVRGGEANFYTRAVPCHGGFPIGSQGRALCLISGGFDSPVAAWLALKRGIRIDFLYCKLGGPFQEWGPRKVSRFLAENWCYGYSPEFFTVDFLPILHALERLDRRYRNILLKRFFLRAANRVAALTGASAVIMGDAIGQVSSQTLANLKSISLAARLFILRPLITYDKVEIMNIARKIGTYDISARVPEFCNVTGKKPRTTSAPEKILALEQKIPQNLFSRLLDSARREPARLLDVAGAPDYPFVKKIPPGSEVVWIQSDPSERPPEHATTILEPGNLSRQLRKLDTSRIIVVDCRQGHLSRDIAQHLRDAGYEAYHLAHK